MEHVKGLWGIKVRQAAHASNTESAHKLLVQRHFRHGYRGLLRASECRQTRTSFFWFSTHHLHLWIEHGRTAIQLVLGAPMLCSHRFSCRLRSPELGFLAARKFLASVRTVAMCVWACLQNEIRTQAYCAIGNESRNSLSLSLSLSLYIYKYTNMCCFLTTYTYTYMHT